MTRPLITTLITLTCGAGLLFGGCKKKKTETPPPATCDVLLQDCEAGQICQLQPDGTGLCEEIVTCDLNNPTCDQGQLCQRQPDGTGVCENIQVCDMGDPNCADGRLCTPQPNNEAWCVVPQPCTIGANECATGEVCTMKPWGEAACGATCDASAIDACDARLACDLLDTGQYACMEPVIVRGDVFDIVEGPGIPDAIVAGANETGIVVTDVAVTDASGNYDLRVPATRDASGAVLDGIYTLRAAAADYLPFPAGIRPAIPIDVTTAVRSDGQYVVTNPITSIGLIPLDPADRGHGKITGDVITDRPGGTLVVAECGTAPCPSGFAAVHGDYVIFNVPPGSYTVKGYKQHQQLIPVDLTMTTDDANGVDLLESSDPLQTVSGTAIEIVNPGNGTATSVVLLPASTFQQITDTFIRGEVAPGLRAPPPPLAPNITGAFSISGVPKGDYVVLAAFENDFLVRDPDPNIAGTQILHITVDATPVVITTGFKITGSLDMVGPGADGPEAITDTVGLEFEFFDDSSEIGYHVELYDALGNLVWEDQNVPSVNGPATVVVPYPATAPALIPGMYYQWRATSYRASGPISTTEDLLGVFYLPTGVN